MKYDYKMESLVQHQTGLEEVRMNEAIHVQQRNRIRLSTKETSVPLITF